MGEHFNAGAQCSLSIKHGDLSLLSLIRQSEGVLWNDKFQIKYNYGALQGKVISRCSMEHRSDRMGAGARPPMPPPKLSLRSICTPPRLMLTEATRCA